MDNLISFIISPEISGLLLVFKIAFIVFGLAAVGFIIFALIHTSWFKRLVTWDLQEFLTYRPYGLRKIIKTWLGIKARLETGTESEYKLALIEADSMLNDILKRMGYGGETLGERLEKLTIISLPSLEEAKEAHKIRNNIVHDPDYRLTLNEAQKVISVYERALTDLQAL